MNKATLGGIGALSFWSTMAALVVYTGEIPTFLLGAITFFIGGLSILAVEHQRTGDIRPLFRLPPKIYAFGVVGMAGYTLLFFAAFKLTVPFIANSLNYLWPILLTLFLAIAQKRKLSGFEMIGLCLGFAGTIGLFATRFDLSAVQFSPRDILGCACATLAAIVWAAYSTLARQVKYPSGATGVFYIIGAAIALILHLVFETMLWPSQQEWIFVVILGIGRVTYALWDNAMKQGDQMLLTSLSYLVPLVSTLWLVIFSDLPASQGVIIAGLAIIIGCVVTNLTKIRQGLRI